MFYGGVKVRKKSSLKNLLTSFFPYVIVLILGFVKVDVFLRSLGEEIYALNQLFFQLFAYISLAEAGASGYIVQLYYKHFVSGNREKIKEIYCGSKKFMQKVAIIVMSIGFVVSFFLRFLTNNHLSSFYMQIVFLLFILRSVIEYLLMSPKLVMQADQKLYKINIVYYILKILELIFEIGLLLIGMDYIVTILSSIILRTLSYLFVNYRVFKDYPWLKEKINDTDIKIKGVNNMFVHRIAEAIHYNTDILLASSFLSPFIVTVYSSYNYITKYLTDGVDILGNSISASVGNVIYKEKNDDRIKILEELLSFYLFLAVFFCTVCFITIDSFIVLWIGKRYIITFLGLIFLIVNLFIVIARKPLNIYYTSAGWYRETRLIVILEAIVNLVFSILLVNKFRVAGLLFATTISMLTTTFWFVPKLVIKDKLNHNLTLFYIRYFLAFILMTFMSFCGFYFVSHLKIRSYFLWFFVAALTSIVVLLIDVVVFYLFSDSFKRFFLKIAGMLKLKVGVDSKMKKNINKKKNNVSKFNFKDIFNFSNKINILYVYLLVLPIIDLITALQTRFTSFSLTIGVLLKGVLMVIIIYYLLFKCKSCNKKLLIMYFISLGIFSLLYLVTKQDIGSIGYLIKECMNIFKFSFYPILIIGLFNLYKEKIIDFDYVSSILSYTFIVYIIFIFFPYITRTGFKSYGLLEIENGTVGWFYAANELGSILILLFSFIYLHLERERYLLFMFFGLLGSYTSFIIGTKVASFGIIIVSVIMTLYYLIKRGNNKWKKFILALIIMLVGVYSFRIGPTVDNVNDNYSRFETVEQDDDIYISPKNKMESFALSLLSGREKFLVRTGISYYNAPVFDKFVGLGFTPRKSHYSKSTSRLIEMDYFDMFFRFGIFGFIVLNIPVLYLLFKMFKSIVVGKCKFNIDFIKYFLIFAMVLFIGFISGHVLGSPAVSFYLGIITLFMYKSLKEV